jgi:hypothetical protein
MITAFNTIKLCPRDVVLRKHLHLVYKLFECFIATQDGKPIVQRLHAFDPTAIWSWDLGFVCMDGSCLLRVSPVFDTGYESKGTE